MRLTCKQLGYTLASQVFRSISIDLDRNATGQEMLKIRTMALRSLAAFGGTKELKICGLSLPSAVSVFPPEVLIAQRKQFEEDLRSYLVDAISSLTGIYKVM